MKADRMKFMNVMSKSVLIGILIILVPSLGLAIPPLHLSAPRNFVTCTAPVQVLPMDLDADGDLDVAVRCDTIYSFDELKGVPQLQLFENPGDGTLVHHSTIPLPENANLIQTNLRGEGYLDMAQTDLNGDGRLDLVQVYTVAYPNKGELLTLVQDGPFSFTAKTQSLPFPASKLCVGDLDGINGPDVVINDDRISPEVHIYLANGAGSFDFYATYETEIPNVLTPVINVFDCKLADLDKDGNEDLIVTNIFIDQLFGITGKNVVILWNRGDGTLGHFNKILDNFLGDQLAIADMDRNGYQDIVTTGLFHLILLRNQGNRVFQHHDWQVSEAADELGGVELSDVDGDGDLDVGVMLFGPLSGDFQDALTDRWALLRNNLTIDGGGNFSAPEFYPAGADIMDLAFADLGVSGTPDALTVASDDDRVSVYYNEAGQYPRPTIISVVDPRPYDGSNPSDIANGDFNGDGLIDLAIINNSSYSLVEGVPDTLALLQGIPGGISEKPSFIDLPAETPSRIIMDQIAGSPASDIGITFKGDYVFGLPVGVALSLGVAGALPAPFKFTPLPDGVPHTWTGLAALDVNSDGTRDLAVLRKWQNRIAAYIDILPITDNGTITYLGYLMLGNEDTLDDRCPYAITSADMNSDGRRDIIAVTKSLFFEKPAFISVVLNNGDETFMPIREIPTVARRITDITAADLTGDGLPDIALTTVPLTLDAVRDDSLEVFPNLGGGNLGEAVSYNVGIGPMRVAAAQVDGVAGLDLVVANDNSNEITVLFNDGHGGFPLQERYLSGGGCDALTIADMDRDGDQDVAVANDGHMLVSRYHRATVSILFNRTKFSKSCEGDFDTDGDVDGSDLATFAAGGTTITLEEFATDFGRTDCSD